MIADGATAISSPHALLVRRMQEGKQVAHGDRLYAGTGQFINRTADRGFIERHNDVALCGETCSTPLATECAGCEEDW